MRALQAAGLAGLAEPPPAISPAAEMALDCWGFCAGWQPERWPVYEALHPVPDWHHLMELLRVIRSTLREIDNSKP
jgi:hypothetical protein